ncbi:MAG: ABC transporter substrate-binding protein [Alphaproteobacteria bacterium]|nr:ABC transporter substrate-binding protein [Alphaproteobacteria bacterium]MBL6672527.1 ABC transporter substrate-binding protein [Alphaproteobacteria bacterium]
MRSFLSCSHLSLPRRMAVTTAICLAVATSLPASADVITAHGISTFGELKYGADFEHLDYVNPDAPKGGEISLWGFGSFDSMHPYSTKGRSGQYSSIFFESLLEGSSDEPDSVYGLVAESLEYPEDRSEVIFNMRPEARFSDGSPLTAADVVFSYEVLRDKGLPSFRAVIEKQIESAEALGPHRVKFTFKDGVPTRDLPQTVGGLPIFSKAYYETSGADFEESTLTPAIGSGPYVLESIDVGQQIIYKRNPDYWGKDLPINKGRHNFDTIRIEYFADYNSAFEGFKAGTYTFRSEASSKIWATAYDFPAIEKGWAVKDTPPDGTLASGQSFLFNLRRERFQDIRVRKAIGMMFNFEWSNKTLFYGIYARMQSFWENSYLKASGMPQAGELAFLTPLADILPQGVLDSPAVTPPISSERQLDRKKLRAASALLDEAGWPVGDDGMRRNAAGDTLKLEFLNDSQSFDRVINPFVENLRKLGVDAVHTRVDNAQATERERNFHFDVVTGNFRTSLTSGAGLKQYFGSETADISIFNLAGYKSEAADRLIENVIAAEDRETLNDATRALDRVLRAEVFWVPQWFRNTHNIAYYDMYRYPDTLPPYALGVLDFWWFDQDAYARLKAEGAF